MDHDLLLDLRHLDDPDPPRFGELRAEEAARRAAVAHSRRARLVAGAVLAVAVVAGIGVVAVGSGSAPDRIESAGAPPTSVELRPDESASTPSAPPDTAAPADGQRPSTAPATPQPPTTVAAPVTTLPGAVPAPGGGPSATTPSGAAPPISASVTATGRPPDGTVPTPSDLRFTLTLESDRVPAGGMIRGRVRFENNRSTAVTVVGGNSCDPYPTVLYVDGKLAGDGRRCPGYHEKEVAPGASVESPVEVWAASGLRPGTYDVFSVLSLRGDAVGIHSDRHVVTVVRS